MIAALTADEPLHNAIWPNSNPKMLNYISGDARKYIVLINNNNFYRRLVLHTRLHTRFY